MPQPRQYLGFVQAPGTRRLLLGFSFLCGISLVSPARRADGRLALLADEAPCFAGQCFSWTREAVVVDSPATLSGTATTFRITGRAPGGETVFDRTVDSLDPSADQPSVASAVAEARRAIGDASPRPVMASAPTLVESTSIQVASIPLAILVPKTTFDYKSFTYEAYATFCVGDLGSGPSPSGLPWVPRHPPFVCGNGFTMRFGYSWPLFSPPWYTITLGTLRDTHVNSRLEVHRTTLFTGTLNIRHLELVGEEPVEANAGSDAGGSK